MTFSFNKTAKPVSKFFGHIIAHQGLGFSEVEVYANTTHTIPKLKTDIR